jgi:hypothetical protein
MEQTKECNYAKQFIQHIKRGDRRFIEGKLRGFCKIATVEASALYSRDCYNPFNLLLPF